MNLTVEELKVVITTDTSELQKTTKNLRASLLGVNKEASKDAKSLRDNYRKAFSSVMEKTSTDKTTSQFADSFNNAFDSIRTGANRMSTQLAGVASEINKAMGSIGVNAGLSLGDEHFTDLQSLLQFQRDLEQEAYDINSSIAETETELASLKQTYEELLKKAEELKAVSKVGFGKEATEEQKKSAQELFSVYSQIEQKISKIANTEIQLKGFNNQYTEISKKIHDFRTQLQQIGGFGEDFDLSKIKEAIYGSIDTLSLEQLKTLYDILSNRVNKYKEALKQAESIAKTTTTDQKAELASVESQIEKLEKRLKKLLDTWDAQTKQFKDFTFQISGQYPSSEDILTTFPKLQGVQKEIGETGAELDALKAKQKQLNEEIAKGADEQAKAKEQVIQYKNKLQSAIQAASQVKDRIKEVESGTKQATKAQNKYNRGLLSSIKMMAKFRIISTVISSITKDFKECYDLLMRFDNELNNNSLGYNQQMSNVTSMLKQVNAEFAITAAELMATFGPVLTWLAGALRDIIQLVNVFIASVSGRDQVTEVNEEYWKNYAESIRETNKELSKYLASFDELNVIHKNTNTTLLNPEDLYKVRDLTDEEKANSKLAAGFGVLAGVTALVAKWMKNKNSVLKKQTSLTKSDRAAVKNLASEMNLGLVPALGLVGVATNGLVWTLKGLDEGMSPVRASLYSLAHQAGATGQTFSNLSVAIEAIKNGIKQLKDKKITVTADALTTYNYESIKSSLDSFVDKDIKVTADVSAVKSAIDGIVAANPKVVFDSEIQGISAIQAAIDGVILANPTVNFKADTTGVKAAIDGIKQTKISIDIDTAKAKNEINSLRNIIDNQMFGIKTAIKNAVDTANNIDLSKSNNTVTQWAKGAVDGAKATKDGFEEFNKDASNVLNKFASNVAGLFGELGSNIVANNNNALSTAQDNMNRFYQDSTANANQYAEKTTTIWQKIGQVLSKIAGVQNKFYSGFDTVMRNAFNGTKSSFGSFSPIPFGGLIPGFADGGVLTTPTVGLMAEYSGAKTNPEIVSPQSLMKETMEDANNNVVNALYGVCNRIIKTIEEKNTDIYMDGDRLTRTITKKQEVYNRNRGTALVRVE